MSERVVILGGSGHARVVAEIIEDQADFQIAAFVAPGGGKSIHGYPCLQSDEELPPLLDDGIRFAFVAIGDNRRRGACIAMVRSFGFSLANAISPAAIVSRRILLGEGIAIMPGAVVNTDSVIEDGVILNTNSSLDHDCFAGFCAHIAPGAAVAGNVKIDEGAFIGAGASIIPRVKIGAWATIGAGAAVVRDIPGRAVACGVPARILKYKEDEG